MTVVLKRHNWTTATQEERPVNTAVLQEMVDILFARNQRWKQDPEWFDRKLRQWQLDLDRVPAAVPVVAPKAVRRTGPYQTFLAEQMRQGRSMKDAAALWKAQRA